MWRPRQRTKLNKRPRKVKEYAQDEEETQEEEGVIVTRHGIVTGLPQVEDEPPDPGMPRPPGITTRHGHPC
jgi:hypothetical protein